MPSSLHLGGRVVESVVVNLRVAFRLYGGRGGGWGRQLDQGLSVSKKGRERGEG